MNSVRIILTHVYFGLLAKTNAECTAGLKFWRGRKSTALCFAGAIFTDYGWEDIGQWLFTLLAFHATS